MNSRLLDSPSAGCQIHQKVRKPCVASHAARMLRSSAGGTFLTPHSGHLQIMHAKSTEIQYALLIELEVT